MDDKTILDSAPLSPEAKSLLRPEHDPWSFFELLTVKELQVEALRFFPYILDKRRAAWWGCQCSWEMNRPEPPRHFQDALRAAVQWILDPSEANRQAAHEPGERAGLGTSAGALALAVHWSDGSLTPPELPFVAAPNDLTAHLIGSAVLLAAVERDPMYSIDHHRMFIALGREIAGGRNLWETTESVQRTIRSQEVAVGM